MTVGFPRMKQEPGERRDFLPDFVRRIAEAGHDVLVERGIGSGMQLTDADYTAVSPRVRLGTYEEAWRQKLVIILRCPEVEQLETLLETGTTLIAMIHFPTRPRRIKLLKRLGCEAISLDSIADDDGRRLVENTKAVGWNGVEAAFEALAPERLVRREDPIRVTIMGAGLVGKHAVEAALKYGSLERAAAWAATHAPVEVVTIGRSLTSDERYLRDRFSRTDILVDATQRSDSSRPLIPNAWIAWLPSHAVICDLVVDPYVPAGNPPTVRSIEGIPKGSLDQWIFRPDDPGWSKTIPDGVPTTHRRATVTCYSWPGIHPDVCMRHYGRQLWPFVQRLLTRGGVEGLSADGIVIDRALWRASLRSWRVDGDRVEHD